MPWPSTAPGAGLLDFLKKKAGSTLDSIGDMADSPEAQELTNQSFIARYGKTKPEKELEAWNTRPSQDMSYEDAQRFGAGRQFAKNWGQYPGAVRSARFIADLLHSPFDSERQELAGQGIEQGLQEYNAANRNKVKVGGGWGDW